jgi:phosphoribosylformylglycinamidine cyclo-ligase
LSLRTAYADSGVDVDAGDRAVDLMRGHLGVSPADRLGGIGAFGAVLALPEDMDHPLLVTSTDGVGTKTEIARRLGRYDTIGQDLVAMCVDDIVCHGATAYYFLDYLAVGRVVPERVAEIVRGVARAAESAGCALVGGETAEHPGIMAEQEFDLAGFCIGFVERDALIDGSKAREGDVVVGLASDGLHANGYSLVRSLLESGSLALTDDLLTPTRVYLSQVLALLDTLTHSGARVGGLAHVTGGGLVTNLPRAIGSAELGVLIDPSSWPEPEIFRRISRAAGIRADECRAIFNDGIGFAIVVEPDAADATVGILANDGVDAWVIGEVKSRGLLGDKRYAEA